jgi:hypothetical protein
LVVAASLWFSSPLPVKALTITFPSLPSSGTLGQNYSFTVQVNIQNQDLLPIVSADLEIHNTAAPSTYAVICNNLPLSNNTTQYTSSNGNVSVTATTGAGWGGGSSASRTAYWGGYGYSLSGGYGYGYAAGSGNTSITYSITWSTPAGWPAGNYYAKVIIHGDNTRTFSETSTNFSLTSPGGGPVGPGGGGGGVAPSPGCTSLTLYTNDEGVFNLSATIKSGDGKVQITIDKGTRARTRTDTRLTQICIQKMTDPPMTSANTSIIGSAYDISPDGATLTPSVTLTITYDPAQLPAGVDQKKLVLATWDSAVGKWVEFKGCFVDTMAHTVSAQITHFTPFGIIAHTGPAAFVVSDLTISPTEVNAGETVTISVQVINNGDLAGSSNLTLKVNNVYVASKDVLLAGGATQSVEFTVTEDVGGTYNVDVNGLTGTFTVKLPSTPATFTLSALSISPAVADIGQTVTISILVTNDGDLSGTYRVIAKIDGVALPFKEITVAGHTSQQVTFTTMKATAGTYTVTIDGQSGTFTVGPTLPPPTVINWWLIGGIICGIVIIAVIVLLTVRRRAM